MAHPFEDEIATRAVRLANLCRNPGDAVHVLKMLAVALAEQVDGIRQPGVSLEGAAGSLLMTTTAFAAVDLECTPAEAASAIGDAVVTILKRREQSVAATGGVA
jgi:hypothetical protein